MWVCSYPISSPHSEYLCCREWHCHSVALTTTGGSAEELERYTIELDPKGIIGEVCFRYFKHLIWSMVGQWEDQQSDHEGTIEKGHQVGKVCFGSDPNQMGWWVGMNQKSMIHDTHPKTSRKHLKIRKPGLYSLNYLHMMDETQDCRRQETRLYHNIRNLLCLSSDWFLNV